MVGLDPFLDKLFEFGLCDDWGGRCSWCYLIAFRWFGLFGEEGKVAIIEESAWQVDCFFDKTQHGDPLS